MNVLAKASSNLIDLPTDRECELPSCIRCEGVASQRGRELLKLSPYQAMIGEEGEDNLCHSDKPSA